MAAPDLTRRSADGRTLNGWAHGVWEGWRRFWFTPQDPLVVSLMRWPLVGMILYTHLIWTLDFDAFFAATDSWQSRDLVERLQADQFAYSFWWSIPAGWMFATHSVCLVILAMYWVGLATPVCRWLTLLIVISYAHRAPLAMYGLDQVNGIAAFYLALSPCGARLSVDAYLRRKFSRAEPTESVAARIATRLIQVQLAYIYLWGGLGKLQGETWWNGEAVWLTAANLDYQSNSLTWLIHVPWLYQALTIATWVWEISFVVLVWLPRLRPWVLAVGVSMHLGIGMFLGMWTFGLAMIFLYLSFLTPETARAVAAWFRSLADVEGP